MRKSHVKEARFDSHSVVTVCLRKQLKLEHKGALLGV